MSSEQRISSLLFHKLFHYSVLLDENLNPRLNYLKRYFHREFFSGLDFTPSCLSLETKTGKEEQGRVWFSKSSGG